MIKRKKNLKKPGESRNQKAETKPGKEKRGKQILPSASSSLKSVFTGSRITGLDKLRAHAHIICLQLYLHQVNKFRGT